MKMAVFWSHHFVLALVPFWGVLTEVYISTYIYIFMKNRVNMRLLYDKIIILFLLSSDLSISFFSVSLLFPSFFSFSSFPLFSFLSFFFPLFSQQFHIYDPDKIHAYDDHSILSKPQRSEQR